MTEVRPSISRQFDVLPPHSVDAERAVVGSMVLDPQAVPIVLGVIDGTAFYQQDHAEIFRVVCDLYESGKTCDALILREELKRRDLLAEVGGAAYLGEVLYSVPTAAHALHYAEIVRECHVKRQLIEVSNRMLRRAYAPAAGDAAQEMVDEAVASLARVTTRRSGSAEQLGTLLDQTRADLAAGGVPLVPTGFVGLDEAVGGFGLGEMWLVGARPSMGKSTLVRQIAVRSAMGGVPTAVVSLEETKPKIARNVLAAECRIDNHRLRKPKHLGEDDWRKLDEGIAGLRNAPLYVVDRARRLSDIRAELALLVARHGVKLAVVDYLQRVQTPGKDKYERAGNASEGLSDLFKELNVAGVVPVQLNRNVEHREEKTPGMSDLRDSGQIEQDADGILFLHREDYYHISEPDYRPTGIAELVVAKMRDGERGQSVKLESCLRFQTFEDIARGADPRDPFLATASVAAHDPTEGMFT